jgi:hypothetical protein
MVRGVTALCEATDAFVALTDAVEGQPGLVPAGVAAGAGTPPPSVMAAMTQAAGSGAFAGRSQSVRRGTGAWSRFLENGRVSLEEDGHGMKIGSPLVVDGAVVGLVGVVVPSGRADQRDRTAEVALVADLGSAALRRLSGHQL